MRKTYLIIILSLIILSACTNAADLTAAQIPASITSTDTVPESTSTLEPESVDPTATEPVIASTTAVPQDDFFTELGIALPAPTCSALTQQQTEGPYYKPNTPEKHSLLEEGMTGTRLILVGYVLDQNCQPLPNAWLDFWQADANGEYDNAGYRLRGHQFTDAQGLGVIGGIVIGLLLEIVKVPFLSLYNVSPEVITNASYVIDITALFLWLRVNNMTIVVGILRAGGDTRFSLFLDGIIIWLVGVPMAFLGANVFHLPVYLVYLCAMSEEVAKWFLGLHRYRSKKWINNLAAQVEGI